MKRASKGGTEKGVLVDMKEDLFRAPTRRERRRFHFARGKPLCQIQNVNC